ncbi:MAG: Enoyl-CoA hydratase [Labilithrix sp.]|nr:Enoyl-CoA hydratase [Labilithrix sp.]
MEAAARGVGGTSPGDVIESPPGGDRVVHSELRADGVFVVTLDDRTATHNTITEAFGPQLSAALERGERDTRVRAVVIRSDKPGSFLVGANIPGLAALRFAKDGEDAALALAARMMRIAKAVKPVVACVHGHALGGGLELALACTAAIATEDPRTVFGLPDVRLGVLAAGNGLLRIAERAGLETALDLGLTGRSIDAHAALALGLVDEVVPPPTALEHACAFALRLADRPELRRSLGARRAWQRHRGSTLRELRGVAPRLLNEKNPVGRALLFRRARAANAHKTRGHYPATDYLIDVLDCYGSKGFRAAARLEARLFGELVVSETSRRLVELFHALTATKKDRGIEPEEQAELQATPRPVTHIAVVGAGLMGAGIASASVRAGLRVHLSDRNPHALEQAGAYVRGVLDDRLRRGRIDAHQRDHALSCLERGRDDDGIRGVDLVVEAVFEDLELKHEVLAYIEARVKAETTIGSNTSSLPIGEIARAARHPERVVGMHYSSPVHHTRLLEVVRTAHTDARAVVTAVEVGKRQGKHVIVVNDRTGFYTTRIVWPLVREALSMLSDGVRIEAIDEALVDWGFPIGPLLFLDETGIDLATHVAEVLEGAYGERMRAPRALATLRTDDRRGKKNGRGFYLHGSSHVTDRRVDETVYHALRPVARPRLMPDDISLRCTMAMVNEALRCLEEGVLRSARDGDIGAVYGVSFPSFRGGPFRYVDVLGAPEILRRTRSLEARFGPRFEPAPLLVEMARQGKRFYG